MEYEQFLQTKQKNHILSGFDIEESDLNENMFHFQKFIVKRALKAGKYAIFADCGLGKTLMQLEWANQVYIKTRKPGINLVPIQNNIPFDLWCKIAEPVWIDVEEGDTLDYRQARDSNDERHITPTQLKPIEWCYNMWCNKGETVLSPFSGIASEGVVAIASGRKYIGVELKESYFDLSIKNLNNAELLANVPTLFDLETIQQ